MNSERVLRNRTMSLERVEQRLDQCGLFVRNSAAFFEDNWIPSKIGFCTGPNCPNQIQQFGYISVYREPLIDIMDI